MATQKVVVEGSSVTAPQLSDLFRQIGDGSITGAHIQAFLERRNPFETLMDRDSQLSRWRTLCQQMFGIELDLGSISVPQQTAGFDRLVVVPQGLTPGKVIEAMRRDLAVDTYGVDLDATLDPTKEERSNTEKPYGVWVRDRIEADEENANKSAHDISTKKLATETLLERLLHETMFFFETRKHLDEKNWTLCSGSRFSDGGVPGVTWIPDYRKLCVDWCSVHDLYSDIRARSVVS